VATMLPLAETASNRLIPPPFNPDIS